MAGAKRTEISIEFEEVVVIRKRESPVSAWCPRCGQRVPMLMADDAARTAKVSARALYRLVEKGRVHFTEALDGSLMVCANSLEEALGPLSVERPEQTTKAIDSAVAIDSSPITEGEEYDE